MNQGARDENDRMYRQKVVGLLERIAARLEGADSSASANSDYAAALRVYAEWINTERPQVKGLTPFFQWKGLTPFFQWVEQRLNASTHIA